MPAATLATSSRKAGTMSVNINQNMTVVRDGDCVGVITWIGREDLIWHGRVGLIGRLDRLGEIFNDILEDDYFDTILGQAIEEVSFEESQDANV